MKINIKFEALSVLMTGLKDTQMWVIYQLASGKNLPDSVTKMDLLKIITFLFKQLDWIEETEDSRHRKWVYTAPPTIWNRR